MRFNTRRTMWPPLKKAGFLLVLAALSACEVPTELPIIEVRWVFPIDDQSISVTELLPTNVAVSGGSFQVTVAPFALTQTLGTLCPACAALNGLMVPTPPFNLSFNEMGTLGTDVVSVEMESGTISLSIENDLGFDPLRPAAARQGTMTITIYDVDVLGRVLGTTVLDGATDALPTGETTVVPLVLTAGTVSSTILSVIEMDSPLGDTNVLIDVTASLNITVDAGDILVSAVTVNVDGLSVSPPQTDLDVSDIEADLVENIQSGSLLLDIVNPFGVGLAVDVEIGGTGINTIQKSLVIGSGATTSATLTYTGPELQSFLGQPDVFFRVTGTVSSPGVPATVTPSQEVSIAASLDVLVELGR